MAAPDNPPPDHPPAAEAELLGRVREVARRITERVRKVLDDTKADQPALPGDGTAEAPPTG
jgi:hypothetical protein